MVRKGELSSNRAIKLRLFPTKRQEKKMRHNMNISRFVYVYIRKKHLQEYETFEKVCSDYRQTIPENTSKEDIVKMLKVFQEENIKKYIHPPRVLNTMLTQEIKENPEKFVQFGDYDSIARHDTICVNYNNAYNAFIKGLTSGKTCERVKAKRKKLKEKGSNKALKFPRDYGFPAYKLKSEANSYPTAIPRNKLNVEAKKVYLPKIGWARFSSNQEIPDFTFPSVDLGHPIVSTDGHDFYLSFGYYKEPEPYYIEDTPILGIDLGLKNVAILSDGTVIPNVDNNPKVIKLNNKIKKLQRKLCWLREHSAPIYARKQQVSKEDWAKEKWKIETRQTRRIQERITKTYIALDNYKNNLLHEQCSEIIKKNPKGIVFESLNIKVCNKIKNQLRKYNKQACISLNKL